MVPTLTGTTGIRGTGKEHMRWNGTVPCTIMVAVVVAEVQTMVRRMQMASQDMSRPCYILGLRKRRRSTSPYERDSRPRYDDYGRQQVLQMSHWL